MIGGDEGMTLANGFFGKSKFTCRAAFLLIVTSLRINGKLMPFFAYLTLRYNMTNIDLLKVRQALSPSTIQFCQLRHNHCYFYEIKLFNSIQDNSITSLSRKEIDVILGLPI